jgi:hypothetical protein
MKMHAELSHEETSVWILGNLHSKYLAVHDRITHGNETMEKTRLAIFRECVALWRAEQTAGSIAAFELCVAMQSPPSKSISPCEGWTKAMRGMQGLYVSEKYAEVTLGMMRDKIGNGIYFGVSNITEWINRYVGVSRFSEQVITMLAIARSRLGGIVLARSDAAQRKACVHFDPLARSEAAHTLHDKLGTKITAFDEIVRSHLLSSMMADASIMATDASGVRQCLYGEMTWEYLALDNVSVKVTLPADMPQALRRDMVQRADFHASHFYANIMERAVTVAIWLYVSGKVESIARVRYDKYGQNTEPISVD